MARNAKEEMAWKPRRLRKEDMDARVAHLQKNLPHVVRGVEFVFVAGTRAVLVAYHADEAAYEADFGRFRQ